MRKLTVLSYGGGQDSKTLLMKYIRDAEFRLRYAPEDFVVVMSATGDEHDHTYRDLEEVQRLCREHHIEFHHITPNMGFHSPAWSDLISPQKRGPDSPFEATLVQLGTKSCTDHLKISVIYKFLDEWINTRYQYGFKIAKERGCGKRAMKRFVEEHGNIHVMIGFAAGEESRMNKSLVLQAKQQADEGDCFWKGITRQFPLIDMGMDRKACQQYIASTGVTVPYPSNCMRCPYMSPEELLWLFIHAPAKYHEWVEIEAAKLERFRHLEGTQSLDREGNPKQDSKGKPVMFKNHGVFNTKETIPEKLDRVWSKYLHMTYPELLAFLDDFKMNHGCSKGNY